MALEVRVVNVELPAVLNEYVDATFSGFGTPQAVIAFGTSANVGESGFSNATTQAIGFYDGTTQLSMCWSARIGVSAFTGVSRSVTGARTLIFAQKDSSPPVYTRLAEYTASMITDGVRLTLSVDNTSINRYATVVLIKGLAAVKVAGSAVDAGSTISETGVGFKADALLTMVAYATQSDWHGSTGLDNENVLNSIGVALRNTADDTALVQHCINVSCGTAVTSMVNTSINNDCFDRRYLDDGASLNIKRTITGFTSNGFNVSSTGSNNASIGYLAMKFDDPGEVFAGMFDTKTSTGTQAYTGVGFEPQALFILGMSSTAVNSSETSPGRGANVAAVAENGSGFTSGSYATALRDAVSATVSAGSRYFTNTLNIWNADSTWAAVATADIDSFDSDGFTLNYSAADATARKFIALAFKKPSEGGYTHPTLSNATLIANGSQWQPRVTYTFT